MFSANHKLLFTCQCLIGLVATASLVWWLGFENLYRTAGQLSPTRVGQAACMAVVGLFVQAEKWRVLLVHLIPRATRKEALASLLAGMGLGLFTPGRVGELGRGLFFSSKIRKIALLTAADRGISMAVTVLFGSLSFALLEMHYLSLACFSLLLLSIGTILFIRNGNTVRFRLLERIVVVFPLVPQRAWLVSILWAVLFNCIFFMQFSLLLCGDEEGALRASALAPAIFVVKSLMPISFFDIGIREGAAVWLFTKRGLNPLPAFNAAFGMFVLNVAVPGAVGWYFVARAALKKHGIGIDRKDVE